MARVRPYPRPLPGIAGWTFRCPACDDWHSIEVRADGTGWTFNNNVQLPTFAPSVLVRSGHFSPGHAGDCWCNYEERHGKPAPFRCKRCHSHVRDGRIEFLGDCSHKLAGRTVDLPDLD